MTHTTASWRTNTTGVPSSLVNEVVSLLVDEREDELQALLKRTYAMDDQSVCSPHPP